MTKMMMTDDTFGISWDENDMVQVEEDDWVSSILGSEDEVINDICNF